MLAYAMSVTAICSGLRPKEVRLSRINDLDLDGAQLHAVEVKGDKRYGEPRFTAIHPDAIPFLRRYLRVRAEMLTRKYIVTDVLFPAVQDFYHGDGFYSSNGTSELRKLVMRETGVMYDLRACRRTFGQFAIDSNVDIEAVSSMMGHATTKTTENYYGRKKNSAAVAQAQLAWRTPSQTQPDVNPPLIERKGWDAGYA